MVNIRNSSDTLNELMAFKEKYHYIKIKAQRNTEFSVYFIKEFSNCDCS